MMKRCAFHIHTGHSYDCISSASRIVDVALRNGIDYLVICDHDSTEGSLEARSYAQANRLDIQIPVAAEFLTNVGDVIVLGVPEAFEKIPEQAELCATVRQLGGCSVLPHPFKGHDLQAVDYTHIDYIEAFNSRCTLDQNEKAVQLALQESKHMAYGSDAHSVRNILSAVVVFAGDDPFSTQPIPLQLRYTSSINVTLSQLVKGVKTCNTQLTMKCAISLAKSALKKAARLGYASRRPSQ